MYSVFIIANAWNYNFLLCFTLLRVCFPFGNRGAKVGLFFELTKLFTLPKRCIKNI